MLSFEMTSRGIFFVSINRKNKKVCWILINMYEALENLVAKLFQLLLVVCWKATNQRLWERKGKLLYSTLTSVFVIQRNLYFLLL